ncbi:hypothetical protein VTJ49DRAFT_3096 [Mycothermus thermophilus]|uniref:Short-chain alcohol dehydrogenase n=1 Tax=Humicola insolens TaxID=85995 RepID=A0ABR3V8E8_HUMIN
MASKTLLIIGSGPGISRSVATLFASRRYKNVGLVARRAESLAAEQAALQQAVGADVKVGIYIVDITDSEALAQALDQADDELGKPETVFFNAARVIPSAFFDHDIKEIEYDLKITVSALYLVAQRYIPHLVSLAKSGEPGTKPALLVTNSALPFHPIPQLFALSLTKAAQRNLVQSLNLTYAPEGVHIGIINVAGPVSPDDAVRNPNNIAAKTWEWFEEGGKEFEVVI